jgi:hypothetical protein
VIERLAGAPVRRGPAPRAGPVEDRVGPCRSWPSVSTAGDPGFTFRDGRADRIWPAFDAGAVIVSEPLAYRRDAAGDAIMCAPISV